MDQDNNILAGLRTLRGINPDLSFSKEDSNYITLPTAIIRPNRYQPRRIFDEKELEELADSIRVQGILQPIIVRPDPDDDCFFEIIAGERRWRAAQLINLKNIPVIIKPLTDEQALVFALIENLQRQDLNPVEEARGLERLVREFNFTHEQVAEAVGKSRVSVTNLLRLLKLTTSVLQWVEEGRLEYGHGRALLSLSDDVQVKLAKEIINRSLSVRETEERVRLYQREQPVEEFETTLLEELSAHCQRWEKSLSNLSVKIKLNAKKKGRVIIPFDGIEEGNWLIDKLKNVLD